jgi:hypothetical protein
MKISAKLYNVIGYSLCVFISILLGWSSTLNGELNDYVLKLSNSIIPLLLTLLVLYSTLTIHLINELRKLEGDKDLSIVVHALKGNIISEIVFILILFVLLVFKGVLVDNLQCYKDVIGIIVNSLVIFTFLYFIWVIIDVTMGLYDLVIKNINNGK